MHALDVLAHAEPRRMSRAEYDALVERGLFENERVELIHGIVVAMSPVGPSHADPIDVLNRRFVQGIGDRAVVRVQLPFIVSDDSEPEPDVALVPPKRYADHHPDRAFLLVEVAASSLDYDRETKGPLYAASGVPEYWIIDINARCIHAYDTPESDGYARSRRFEVGQSLAPAAFPDLELNVGELFT